MTTVASETASGPAPRADVGFDPLDRLAARVEADADVLTTVAKVQRVGASLAAVADHRHRLAQVGGQSLS